MKKELIKIFKEKGKPLEKSYGCKMFILEEKDFKEFATFIESRLKDKSEPRSKLPCNNPPC